MQLRKETCIGCECELQYTKSIPTKADGCHDAHGGAFLHRWKAGA